MKPTAVLLIATLLFQILMPSLSIAAQELRGNRTTRVNWRKAAGSTWKPQPSEEQRAAESAARLIRMLYEMDVWVMPRRHLDLSKIAKGFYAHVIYTSEGASDTAAGVIRNIDPVGMEITSTATVPEKTHIHYAEIDTIVVAKERPALERWRRRVGGRFVVMSRGTIDLSAMRKGWHAFIVYEFEDGRRGELVRILNTRERHLVIRSSFAGRNQFWAGGEIALNDIVFIVAAEDRRDIVALRHARQILRHLPENPRIRLKSPSTRRGASRSGSVVGRLFDVNQDTLVMGVGLSGNEIFELPISSIRDFEIYIGRHRNTIKGLGIGFFVGLGAAFLIYPHDVFDDYRYEEIDGWEGFDRVVLAVVAVPIATICGAVLGARTVTEQWVEVSPSRINLSVSPTRDKGLRAALSFHF